MMWFSYYVDPSIIVTSTFQHGKFPTFCLDLLSYCCFKKKYDFLFAKQVSEANEFSVSLIRKYVYATNYVTDCR